MGWFKKAFKTLSRPDKILKDPKKATQFALDPAGSLVRAGRGGEMPNNARSLLDPGGFFDGREQANYAAYQAKPMQLSPQAQALYDSMKARSAERQAAKQAQSQQTIPQQAVQQLAGSMYLADGGRLKRKHMSDCQHFESKVFERKRNGKPS